MPSIDKPTSNYVKALAEETCMDIAGVSKCAAKLRKDNKKLAIDLKITVSYGTKIPELAWNAQEIVKKTIERSTKIAVSKVNINIIGVSFEKPEIKNEKN